MSSWTEVGALCFSFLPLLKFEVLVFPGVTFPAMYITTTAMALR